jgi:thiol-disulfide isomerase/thioredoxin
MKIRGFLILIAASMIATSAFAQLTASDVTQIVHHAVARAEAISPNSVIAVTDREGNVLGVWVVRGGNANLPEIAIADGKILTAAPANFDLEVFRFDGFDRKFVLNSFYAAWCHSCAAAARQIDTSAFFLADDHVTC